MNPRTKRTLVISLVIIAVTGFLAAAAMYVNNLLSDRASSSSSGTATVALEDSSFSPASMKVRQGQAVTWTNVGNQARIITVSLETEGAPKEIANSTDPIDTEGSFSFVFNKKGIYHVAARAGDAINNSIVIVE